MPGRHRVPVAINIRDRAKSGKWRGQSLTKFGADPNRGDAGGTGSKKGSEVGGPAMASFSITLRLANREIGRQAADAEQRRATGQARRQYARDRAKRQSPVCKRGSHECYIESGPSAG